jgi:hypothetical protein
MDKQSHSGWVSLRKASSHESEPSPTPIVPYGPYGGGHFTSHPIGWVIAIGFTVMVLVAIPEARWFFAASLVLGIILGIFLWLRNRSKSSF